MSALLILSLLALCVGIWLAGRATTWMIGTAALLLVAGGWGMLIIALAFKMLGLS